MTEARVIAERDSGENWLVNGGRFSGEHYSPLDQINASNVETLGLAWATDVPSFTLGMEPIVVDGAIYVSGALDRVFAFDAATGASLWQFDPEDRLDISVASSWAARLNRGVAVWNGKVYVGTGDCRLIAIDAQRGEKLWETPVCDSTEGMGAGITGAPRVGGGKVFMGYAAGDFQARGSLVAFDAETGRELWRFWTVPGDPARGFESKALEMAAKTWVRDGWAKTGGGSVWEGINYDPETGQVIFGVGTSSTSPVLRGPGDQLFLTSVIAVDAETGEYRWHYQTVPADAWNYDAAMPKIVTDLTLGGKQRRVVFEVPKNGFFYVLDARTGELLAADPIAEVTWASHIDMETGRPVIPQEAKWYENKGLDQPLRYAPGPAGAHSWQAMSFDPETGLVYIPLIDMPSTISAGGFFGVHFAYLGPDDEVPLGRLLAWDPVKRKPRWVVDHPLPINSGVLSTGGNLVFQGTATGEVRAYSADTGRLLWSQKTGTTMQAQPVTYRLGKEQYVLAGGGRAAGTALVVPIRAQAENVAGEGRLFAFKLGGKEPLPASRRRPAPVPRPPARTANAEQIHRGEDLFEDLGCDLCHGAQAMGISERRLGGVVPDLRYAPPEVHEAWHGIVLGGNRRLQGMPSFADSIGVEDSEALHAYVIEQAWKLYEKSAAPQPPE